MNNKKDPSSTLSPYKSKLSQEIEDSLRPKSLEQFQGQSQLKKNLALYVSAALKRGEALDHIFLSGSHGLGKTSLAYIIAHELDVEIKITSAPVIERPKDLIGILSTVPKNTVIFIDEIHRLKPVVEEILYSAMEDFTVDWVIGAGPDARTVRIPIEPFTLIGATTQPGKVTPPLYSRFGIRERLDLYSEEDIAKIIIRSAHILQVDIEPDAAYDIGKMSRGTPRYANNLLKRMRDFSQIHGEGIITKEIVRTSSKEIGIDQHGLEQIDKNILRVLADDYMGNPVGLKTLAIAVNESPESLEDFWEVYLIKRGLLQRTPQGRRITEKGLQVIGKEELINKKGSQLW